MDGVGTRQRIGVTLMSLINRKVETKWSKCNQRENTSSEYVLLQPTTMVWRFPVTCNENAIKYEQIGLKRRNKKRKNKGSRASIRYIIPLLD